ncbi:MAG: nitrous oxide reductase family maturation protein NosD [Planctomycetes bacterium]|nr:nitrous oxide reductase family maturation protein NosD [Planctomycetota bacterium]
MRRAVHIDVLRLGVCSLLAACSAPERESLPDIHVPPPARPVGATVLRAGADLQAALDAAPSGGALELAPGRHAGPLVVRKPITIWGPRDAEIVTNGQGSTVLVESARVRLLGFSVVGSGSRFDLLDSAVRVKGTDIGIEGLSVRDALFGVLVEDSDQVTIRGNRIRGSGQEAMGLRGDGIRLWGVKRSCVEHNDISDCRDMVVWFSTDNVLRHNRVVRSRYGTHFMYGDRSVVHDNQYIDNVVGVFVMYSHDIELRHNVLARSSGSAGMGLGAKESGNLKVTDNVFVQNTKAVHLDTSPLQKDHENVFERNELRLNQCAVYFHGRATKNAFRANAFSDNATLVHCGGRDAARDAVWSGNFFDGYMGYDMDGDGTGDVRHEVRRLSSDLTTRYPDVAFFHGAPAMALIDVAGQVMPLFQPATMLVDEQPRMRPIARSASAGTTGSTGEGPEVHRGR